MKLWQKIFLGTLALMVCCTSLLTLLFVRASWQTVWTELLYRWKMINAQLRWLIFSRMKKGNGFLSEMK